MRRVWAGVLSGRARSAAAIALVAISLLAASCKSEQSSPADSTRAPAASAASASPATTSAAAVTPDSAAAARVAAANACVSEGAWQACSIERRLSDAGFVPVRKGATPPGLFTVAGTAYALGPAELRVYLFASAKERELAVAGIDTVAVARRGATATWPVPPTLITSNNLVAIVLSDNSRLVERVQNAITAGLPSAAR